MAEGDEKAGSQAVSVDMEAMIEEILARKGPQKYQDGLSEDNWEQVHVCTSLSTMCGKHKHTDNSTHILIAAIVLLKESTSGWAGQSTEILISHLCSSLHFLF